MKKYPKYKDSGMEWVGEIPKHWSIISLKHLVSSKITDGPHESPEFIDEGIPFLSVESVQDNKLDFNKKRGFISIEQHLEYSKKCKPRKDDVFLVKSGSTTGKSTIVETDEDFNIWSPLCIIRSDLSKILPRFIFTTFQSEYFRRFIELGWSFGTQPNIGMGVIENIKIITPLLSEQPYIVSFLDQKTSLIDTLIERKLQKIELLKEQRTSIINHTVTKGLNPNVRMKDSGVDWIGEIPEHWKLVRVKYHLSIRDGIKIGPFGSSLKLDTLSDSGVKIYGQVNVIKDDFTLGERYLPVDRFESDFRQYEIFEGDVLVTMMGTTGKSKVFESNFERGILDSHLLRLRFDPTRFFNRLFTLILQESDYVSHQVRVNSKGSIMEGLNSSIIKDLLVVSPPLTEQQQIVQYLDKKTSEIETQITLENRKIDLLKEYRQSLISEVVTGKIDVRKN